MEKRCFECNASDILIAEVGSQSCSNYSGTSSTLFVRSRTWDPSTPASLMEEDLYASDGQIYYQWIHVMQWTEVLNDQIYILGYSNIALNTITYFVPVMMLFILNLLIYIHLRRRRKDIRQLGKDILDLPLYYRIKLLVFRH